MSKSNYSILSLAVAFLNSDAITLVLFILKYGRKVFGLRVHEGMYESLDYKSVLEIKDNKGQFVVLHKFQHIRFLQDNILGFQDFAWGDGDIFHDYKCSVGKPVDTYRDGHRYNVLISLQGTKQRGDEEQIHIERTIKNGFLKEKEDFVTNIYHSTKKLSLSIIFPAERLPNSVEIIEQNTSRTHVLEEIHKATLPDQRLQVTWTTNNPKLFEAYVFRWTW